MDMCLLGYTLSLTLQVFHPYMANKDDFQSLFPPTNEGNTGTSAIPLISEDDRHYNALTTISEPLQL